MSQTEQPIMWAGVLIIRDRRVLTIKEEDKAFYILPGGKIEHGETDKQAAIREVQEELGVSANVESLIIDIIENSKNTGKLIRFKVFNGSLSHEPDINNLPGKTEGIAYVNSKYEEEGIDVGNLLIKILPKLAKEGLID